MNPFYHELINKSSLSRAESNWWCQTRDRNLDSRIFQDRTRSNRTHKLRPALSFNWRIVENVQQYCRICNIPALYLRKSNCNKIVLTNSNENQTETLVFIFIFIRLSIHDTQLSKSNFDIVFRLISTLTFWEHHMMQLNNWIQSATHRMRIINRLRYSCQEALDLKDRRRMTR